LCAVHRQALIAATSGLAAFALSGCATFTDNAAAARVGDTELSHDEIVDILADTPGGTGDAASVRGVTSLFVANELVKAELDGLGVEYVVADVAEAPAGDSLRAEFSVVVETWQGLPVESLADDEVAAFYSAGTSGVVCTAHVLTDTEAEAEAVLAELESGRPFAEVAGEVSTDPSSGVNGGRLGCQALDEFESSFVPEFVAGARGLEIGEISGPVESTFGFHVITKVGFDELGAQDVLQLRVRQFDERYDIYIDPTIGTWTETADIIPLG